MSNMQALITWFLTELPDFLMAEPICYFVGFAMAFTAISLIKKIITIN